MAENGVGRQASASITLSVLREYRCAIYNKLLLFVSDPPEIKMSKDLKSVHHRLEVRGHLVRSLTPSTQAELVCTVHAEPRPEIR